jgi:putative ABC transport system permease protein
VILSHETDATRRARLEREVVDHYPNVSSIDLSTVQETVTRILRRVAVAVRFMAMFSVVTGALVLFSAVAASRRQRIREGVLLKTLGATRAQVRRIMLAEYGVLGLLGSLAGMVLSIGGAWALMRWVFEAPFRVATLPLLAIAVAMMALTIAIGAVGGREVFAATPVRALSEG